MSNKQNKIFKIAIGSTKTTFFKNENDVKMAMSIYKFVVFG